MSRSHRKTPIVGNASDSDKIGKKFGNRRHRKHVNDELTSLKGLQLNGIDDLDEVNEMFNLEEVETHSNDWDFPKDGKHYVDSEVLPDDEYESLITEYGLHAADGFIKQSVYEDLMRK